MIKVVTERHNVEKEIPSIEKTSFRVFAMESSFSLRIFFGKQKIDCKKRFPKIDSKGRNLRFVSYGPKAVKSQFLLFSMVFAICNVGLSPGDTPSGRGLKPTIHYKQKRQNMEKTWSQNSQANKNKCQNENEFWPKICFYQQFWDMTSKSQLQRPTRWYFFSSSGRSDAEAKEDLERKGKRWQKYQKIESLANSRFIF